MRGAHSSGFIQDSVIIIFKKLLVIIRSWQTTDLLANDLTFSRQNWTDIAAAIEDLALTVMRLSDCIFFLRIGHFGKKNFHFMSCGLTAQVWKCWNCGGISHHYSSSSPPSWVSAVLWLFAHSSPFPRPLSLIRCWWRNHPHSPTYCK